MRAQMRLITRRQVFCNSPVEADATPKPMRTADKGPLRIQDPSTGAAFISAKKQNLPPANHVSSSVFGFNPAAKSTSLRPVGGDWNYGDYELDLAGSNNSMISNYDLAWLLTGLLPLAERTWDAVVGDSSTRTQLLKIARRMDAEAENTVEDIPDETLQQLYQESQNHNGNVLAAAQSLGIADQLQKSHTQRVRATLVFHKSALAAKVNVDLCAFWRRITID